MDDPVISIGEKLSPEQAMQLAIEFAKKGRPFVSPNPAVGCVILDQDHKFLSVGFHERYGEKHAEANAFAKIDKAKNKNLHVYVTLEPCAHQGKQPPCADLIVQHSVKKLIYGIVDPFAQVQGRGLEKIKQAGIEIEQATYLKNELLDLAEIFLWNQTQKKPFVALKVATSLDGMLATKDGESKWITGEKSREKAHELRSFYDAILTTVNTVQVDNPTLNIRHPRIQKNNKVIVLDPEARLVQGFENLNISRARPWSDIVLVVGENYFSNARPLIEQEVQILTLPLIQDQNFSKFDLAELLGKLWDLQIKSLFVESGASLLSSFLQEKLGQRLYLFQAPILIGDGISWTKGLQSQSLKNVQRLTKVKVEQNEDDRLWSGILTRPL